MNSANEICTISRNIWHFSNFFRQIFSKSIEYLQFSAIPREIPTKFGQDFTEKSQKSSIFCKNEMKFCSFHFIRAKFWTRFLLKFWDLSGAKECKSCRSRKMLQNEPLVAIVAVDTAENEPLKVWAVSFHYFNPLLTCEIRRCTSRSSAICPPRADSRPVCLCLLQKIFVRMSKSLGQKLPKS